MRLLIAFFALLLAPMALSAQSSKSTKLPVWPSSKPQRLLLIVKPVAGADMASSDPFSNFSDAMMSTRCTVVSVKDGIVNEKEILISHKCSERHVFAMGGNVTVWVEKSTSTIGGKSTTIYTLVGGGYFE